MRRDEELERFKEVNLTVIAAELGGYEIVRKKSTRHSVLMDSGRDKIIVSKNGSHYIYCSVHDPDSNGTVIDFVQNVVELNCSLGRVRQHLRPFLNGEHVAAAKDRHPHKYAESVQPSSVDFLAVAARFSRFDPIEEPHPYLCAKRHVSFELLKRPRVEGLVRHSVKYGSVIFPHWGQPTNDPLDEGRCLVGYEIKGPSVSMYSAEGRKGLFVSRGFDGDRSLVFTESGLDALAYLALHCKSDHSRVVSVGGTLNRDFQLPLIEGAIRKMPAGSEIVAGFDADPPGDRLTEQLAEIVASLAGDGLKFRDHRPTIRGQDWNDVLCDPSADATVRFEPEPPEWDP